MKFLKKKLIIDVGMHIGRDTEFYLLKGFDVIAIEASPDLVKKAQIKFSKYLETGQLRILNLAIAEKKGKVKLFSNIDKDDWSSLNNDWNIPISFGKRRNIKVFNIESTTLDAVINEYGMPYFVKIDIEGSDLDALLSLKNLSEVPKFISVELITSNNLTNFKGNYMDILCTLRALGYTKFQIVDQSLNNSTHAPYPSKEGKYVDYVFDGHTSGLFGKELLEKNWTSIDDVSFKYLTYLKFFEEYKTTAEQEANFYKYPNLISKNPLAWFDIHATN